MTTLYNYGVYQLDMNKKYLVNDRVALYADGTLRYQDNFSPVPKAQLPAYHIVEIIEGRTPERVQSTAIGIAMRTLRNEMESDLSVGGYAYVWYSNLVMSMYDSYPESERTAYTKERCEAAASRFISIAFGVETRNFSGIALQRES